jgi:hypothetical protein
MEVVQGPNWGCSAKGKKIIFSLPPQVSSETHRVSSTMSSFLLDEADHSPPSSAEC